MKDIAIYGAGGFGREIACLINAINGIKPTWNLIGFIDDGVTPGTDLKYDKVIGNCDTLNAIDSELAVAIAIGSPKVLKIVHDKIHNPKVYFPNLIAPDVKFFDKESLTIGQGNLITFGCRLSCFVKIGDFNILNGCISIGHDATIGNFNVMMPETRISGETVVGNCNFFGARSFVAQQLKIGNETKISAGSIILRYTKDGAIYMGNPAQRIRI